MFFRNVCERTGEHGITSQKMELFAITAVRTLNASSEDGGSMFLRNAGELLQN
jgi:hypothetical protein